MYVMMAVRCILQYSLTYSVIEMNSMSSTLYIDIVYLKTLVESMAGCTSLMRRPKNYLTRQPEIALVLERYSCRRY